MEKYIFLKKLETDNVHGEYVTNNEFIPSISNISKFTHHVNINDIVDIFTKRADKDYIAKLVSNKEIAENDYNLSVSTYVEKEDTREKIDIVELNKEIDEIVAKEQVLRKEISKIISEIEV